MDKKQVERDLRASTSIARIKSRPDGGRDFNDAVKHETDYLLGTRDRLKQQLQDTQASLDANTQYAQGALSRERQFKDRSARVGAGRGEVNPKPVGYKAGGMVRRGFGKARGA